MKFNLKVLIASLTGLIILPQYVYKKKRRSSINVAPRFDILEEKQETIYQSEYRLRATNNFPLFVKVYNVPQPKAIVQIVHGALEHHARYQPLIDFLNHNGYAVIANDHRGHGRSVNKAYPKGFLNGPEELIQDLVLVTDFAKSLYPQIPVYLFSHSMGSMLARIYLQNHDQLIDKLVLCGTPYYQPIVSIGIAIAKILSFYQGEKCKNTLLNVLPRGMDWLSSNECHHQAILNDPLKIESFTNAGNLTLFELNQQLRYPSEFEANNPTLPILNIVGEEDQITGYTQGVKSSIDLLTKAGYTYIQSITYPNLKHEIIHEKNGKEVMSDILTFFDA